MAENYYLKREREALARLIADLEKPLDNGAMDGGTYFDPWEPFTGVYGSYAADFDWCAIEVLEGMLPERKGTSRRHDLAAEMFREMLCQAGFCDYGTSPRSCFPTSGVAAVLPRWIERWKDYYQAQWGEPYPAPSER